MTAHDVLGACLVDDGAQGFCVLQQAVEVGLLDVEAGHIGGEQFLQGVHISAAVLHGHHLQLVTSAIAVGADGVDDVGMVVAEMRVTDASDLDTWRRLLPQR